MGSLNGWPPLQYLVIKGLNAYGERESRQIARRWDRDQPAR